MDYTPNQSGLDQVFAEIGAKVEAVDADLRRRFAGAPADEIVDPAAAAFEAAGIQSLEPEWLRAYAEAVSHGADFTLQLG